MIAAAGVFARSDEMASCILHDEQLPQSPTAEMTASHAVSSASVSGGQGRLASALRRRTTSRTRYSVLRISSTASRKGVTLNLLLPSRPTLRSASEASPGARQTASPSAAAVGSSTTILIANSLPYSLG